MPVALIPSSPLAAGVSPVPIAYREAGEGPPLAILHGGWGAAIYPFDRHVDALARDHRVIVPDRTGYGGSGPLDVQPPDFHQRAAEETLALFDALGIRRASLWGHSDGAVIALRLALTVPGQVTAIVAEATHFFRRKPASRTFFETMRDDPDRFGGRVAATLQQEHGDRWRRLLSTNGSAWLAIGDAAADDVDLYGGRLGELNPPILLVHGSSDPRTEPGELEALRQSLVHADVDTLLLDGAGHSPHSERDSAGAVEARVVDFLRALAPGRPARAS
jgi:pimeloyl-ACP methyl ester carboxylesterase